MHFRKLRLTKISLGLIIAVSGSASQAIEPNDPLYSSYYMYPSYYQWGMRTLNMEEAWNYARGHAYLAPLDNGIQTDHPDLQNNFRPRFSRLFYSSDYSIGEDPSEQPPAAGHGTHVAGILAASSNNGIGVAGICWDCSIFMGKLNGFGGFSDHRSPAIGLDWMIRTGAQVINMSFGAPIGTVFGNTEYSNCNQVLAAEQHSKSYVNEDAKSHALRWCEAIEHAEEYDVVLVAAAGNESDQDIDFPASDDRVIAVGAIDFSGNVPAWSSKGPEMDLVAPGVNVLSTIYTDSNWNPEWDCADNLSAPPSYGPCTGSSMATPHVTGIAGILRSINPLLNRDQIKESLTKYASNKDSKNDIYGYGIPDAAASVKDILGVSNGAQLVNRLTPLFGLFSPQGSDHLYTTTPQMAMAAMFGELEPQPDTKIKWNIDYDGQTIPGYSSFPKPGLIWDVPRASVYILTTHNNPVHPNIDLVPLYRLSHQGPYSWITNNVDHAYATTQSEVDAYIENHYQLDGIEGYIFPTTYTEATKPAGTVKLYRKKSRNRDDTAIFPESQLSAMTSRGYTENSGSEWIGYVYPNVDSDSDGLIDGFETILGTNIHYNDSDYDGISDGVEVNNYPYGDPRDPMVH